MGSCAALTLILMFIQCKIDMYAISDGKEILFLLLPFRLS
jgi:hypothetical protein